jgi:hypothetical protein
MMTLAFEGTWTHESTEALQQPQKYVDEKMAYYTKNPLSRAVISQISFKSQPAFVRRVTSEVGIASAVTVFGGKEFALRYTYDTWNAAAEAAFNAVAKSIQFEKPSAAIVPTEKSSVSVQIQQQLSAAQAAQQARQEQLTRALVDASSADTLRDMLQVSLMVKASQLTDIPRLRSFTAKWGEASAALYADWSKIEPQRDTANAMTDIEFNNFIQEITRIGGKAKAILADFNTIPYSPEVEKLFAENPVTDLEPGPPPGYIFTSP